MSSEAYRNPRIEPRRNQIDGLDTAVSALRQSSGQAYSTIVKIRVELFGMPRLHAGLREVELELTAEVTCQQVVRALAEACPALVGQVLKEDLTNLQEGYVFNLNGASFLSGGSFQIQAGDSLLLLSNQAGG